MEEGFRAMAAMVALGVETAVVLIIMIGSIEAALKIVGNLLIRNGGHTTRRDIWLRLAGWICCRSNSRWAPTSFALLSRPVGTT